VIVGGGPSGGQAAMSLRDNGYEGRIIMVGKEPYLPYERPPLSKSTLRADSRLPLMASSDIYNAKSIEVLLSTTVIGLDTSKRRIDLDDGSQLAYEKLLLATGAVVRRLNIPGCEKGNIHFLRTYDDAIVIKNKLIPGNRLVVIGGGFIGLEAAASASELGCRVSVVETGSQLMGRVVPKIIADYFEELHREHGVTVHLGETPVALLGDGQVSGVALSTGAQLKADLVLVGIGIDPNTGLAEQAQLKINDGVIVNEQCRTSNEYIFAVGDLTHQYNPYLGKSFRLESWQNAINQATVAAEVMCGHDTSHAEVPWFWTDQYGCNMQMAGIAGCYDEDVVRGNVRAGDFTVFQMKDDRVVGVITINRGAEMNIAKRMIGTQCTYSASELRSETLKLRKILKR